MTLARTFTAGETLAVVIQGDGATCNEVAAMRGVDPLAAYKTLHRLWEGGVVRPVTGWRHDRRERVWIITEKGQAFFSELCRYHQQVPA